MSQIQGIQFISPVTPLRMPGEKSSPQSAEFKNLMLEALDHVNTMQQNADQAVEQLATGSNVNAAEVLTTIQKADLSFRMMLQVRNKMLQAYQEIRDIRI